MNIQGAAIRETPRTQGYPLGAHPTFVLLFFAFVYSTIPAVAQSKAGAFINEVTPESQFLDLIELVGEPKKQLELFDIFVGQFPKYEGLGTVYAQMQDVCVQLQLWDRALTLGDRLLKIDESDIEAVRLNIKAAEGKNDPVLIAKWKERLKALEPPEGDVTATSTVRLPFVDDDPSGDLGSVDFSTLPKSQKPRVEAILFNRALEEANPKRKLELLSLFQKQFPNSAHMGKIAYLFFLTHRDLKDGPKALAAAEAILTRDKTREDVLFFASQAYFASKNDPAKVLQYCSLTLEIVNAKQKPENFSEEEWAKQKHVLVQQSHWMMGITALQQSQWGEANKSLRAALVEAPAGSELSAAILSNLAWANYKQKNIPEAINLYKQCAAIRGPFQAQALQSITSIKAEYDLQ